MFAQTWRSWQLEHGWQVKPVEVQAKQERLDRREHGRDSPIFEFLGVARGRETRKFGVGKGEGKDVFPWVLSGIVVGKMGWNVSIPSFFVTGRQVEFWRKWK